MSRPTVFHLIAFASLITTLGYAWDNDEPVATTPVADRQGSDADQLNGVDGRQLRLREGMKFVDRVGALKETGGRIAFYPDGEKQSLQLLENLALERVSRDLDQPNRKWSVSGIVTEYRGANYLLLHRAVLKARVSSASGPRS